MTAPDFEARAQLARVALADQLMAAGELRDPAWAEAFAEVPRHVFVPAAYRTDPSTGTTGAVLRADQPGDTDAYLAAVYSDDVVVTQQSEAGAATSSSTQPCVMARMLHRLDVQTGQRVLEIGTGTGYNTALLAHRIGDDEVVSVDIDAQLVDAARDALTRAGYLPLVAAYDGLDGYPPLAPYDRIISTCAIGRVPAAWLEQTRPGGLILATLSHGVVLLRVASDHTAAGRFLPEIAGFIPARTAASRAEWTTPQLLAECLPDTTGSTIGSTAGSTAGGSTFVDIGLHTALSDDAEFDFFWRLLRPGITWCGLDAPDGFIHCLGDAATGSWARAHRRDDYQAGPHIQHVDQPNGYAEVHQHGPRRLWDELDCDHQRWIAAGRPVHQRIGLTITLDGTHHLWIDHPCNPHGTLPSASPAARPAARPVTGRPGRANDHA